jgi:protein-tyrosine phosphatase
MVCTGNAARSVMAASMMSEWSPGLVVTSSGTHVIEGRPVSWRTRGALDRLGLDSTAHRSAQFDDRIVAEADLVVGMAAEHVRWVRRHHPEVADRTATLLRLVRDLPPGPAPLPDRLAALDLAAVELDASWEDVDDPAGGDEETFHDCAGILAPLVRRLGELL